MSGDSASSSVVFGARVRFPDYAPLAIVLDEARVGQFREVRVEERDSNALSNRLGRIDIGGVHLARGQFGDEIVEPDRSVVRLNDRKD